MTADLAFRMPDNRNPKETLDLISNAVKATFGANLKLLLENSGYTREEFCELIDISPASLANYVNGKTLPPVDKLIFIARMFKVELQDLIQSDIETVMTGPSRISRDSYNYPYYCGSFAIHYFDTSQASGHEYRSNDQSVNSGVLVIKREVNTLGSESYPALCVMGISMRNVAEVKGLIDRHKEDTTTTVADILASKHKDKYRSLYHGQLTLNGPQAVVRLSKPNAEISITMQNVALEVNKPSMRCNIGILSSILHGNVHLPFAQKVIISAVPLTHPIRGKEKSMAGYESLFLGPDEIAFYLQAGSPSIDLAPLRDDFIRYIKGLYATAGREMPFLSDLPESYKEAVVMCFLEDALRMAIERNGYRSIKVDGESSNRLYRTVCDIAKHQGLWLEGGE